MTALTLGNSATATFTFDDAGRTTGIRHSKSGGALIAGYEYSYNDVGVPTSVLEGGGDRVTWSYDSTWRLAREQRSGSNAYDITYTFDAAGNRATKLAGGITTTYSYNNGDALTLENAAGTLTTYSFDDAGNSTVVNDNGTLTTMTWDAENRLATLVNAGGTATFTYDATGLRRKRQDGAGTVDFLWDGQKLLMELSGGATQAFYTSPARGPGVSPGGAFGPMLSQRRSTTSRFYHPSLLGTIETLTDASGDPTDTYVMTAFGVQTASSGSTTNPHRFIGSLGYYTDPNGSVYVRARWLRPGTGSWLSVDPVTGEPRYQYVRGRAGWSADPSGLERLWDYPRVRPVPACWCSDPWTVGVVIEPELIPGCGAAWNCMWFRDPHDGNWKWSCSEAPGFGWDVGLSVGLACPVYGPESNLGRTYECGFWIFDVSCAPQPPHPPCWQVQVGWGAGNWGIDVSDTDWACTDPPVPPPPHPQDYWGPGVVRTTNSAGVPITIYE